MITEKAWKVLEAAREYREAATLLNSLPALADEHEWHAADLVRGLAEDKLLAAAMEMGE